MTLTYIIYIQRHTYTLWTASTLKHLCIYNTHALTNTHKLAHIHAHGSTHALTCMHQQTGKSSSNQHMGPGICQPSIYGPELTSPHLDIVLEFHTPISWGMRTMANSQCSGYVSTAQVCLVQALLSESHQHLSVSPTTRERNLQERDNICVWSGWNRPQALQSNFVSLVEVVSRA